MGRATSLVVALVAALFLAGVMVLGFMAVESGPGAATLWLGMLLAIALASYRWGRWNAVLWLGVVLWLTLSIAVDVLWMTGIWDRSDEREPLPLTVIVVPFGIPTFAAAAVCGVALKRFAVGAPATGASGGHARDASGPRPGGGG